MMRRLEELDLRGRVTFVRVDLDVPVGPDKVVKDDRRLRHVLPTLEHLITQGARVVVASHLGRPRGKPDADLSMEPVAMRLASLLGKDVVFADDAVGDGVRKNIRDLREGDVLVLENLGFYAAEERNDEQFARALADGVDAYVDEAFSLAHKTLASNVGMVKLVRDRAPGLAFHREVDRFKALVDQPKRPYVLVMGGASLTERAATIEGMLDRVTTVLVGGALAYTMLAAKNKSIGRSRVEPEALPVAERIMKAAAARKVTLLLPDDHVVGATFDETAAIEEVTEIREGFVGLDIGPKTRERWTKLITSAGTVFWSGPLGVSEWSRFSEGTKAIAIACASTKATTIVSGDDTVAALTAAGLAAKVTHTSAGGAASLELLAGRPMPGVKALD
ncbi:phosphoglycerate kinase [Myxococcota bacterium]|nr:phosphoglycerate kinase [Myxococcota bacterium]